jgi:hypothetical protein
MLTIQDRHEGERVARALLEGSGFAGFTFSTHFTLRFSRSKPGSYAGQQLPAEVELVLRETWWLGDEAAWRDNVARLAPAGAVEPDEPVQALELAVLRWTSGALVESVVVTSGALSLRFENGQVLTAAAELEEGDTAWSIVVAGEPETKARWSVVSVGGELFVRTPT